MWTDPMRGVRIFVITLCLAFLVGGLIQRQSIFRPGFLVGGADSAEIALFQARAAYVIDPAQVKIAINDADAHELTALPGIGPVKAAAIVEYREIHGPFRQASDLQQVKGIGPKTVAKIHPLIDLGGDSSGMDTQPAAESSPARIHINQADIQELVKLPGIGPVKAAAIVEYRESYGPFRHPDDLLRVKGIGPKTLEKIKPKIQLDSTGIHD
jgi:competence protein ComEA